MTLGQPVRVLPYKWPGVVVAVGHLKVEVEFDDPGAHPRRWIDAENVEPYTPEEVGQEGLF